jgi:ribosomal protein S6
MKRVGTKVYGTGGVVTKVASYGSNELAYPVKRAGETFNEGEMWQMHFHSPPTLVKDLRKILSEDHRVLRQLVLKEPQWPPLYYFSSSALQEVVDVNKDQLVDEYEEHGLEDYVQQEGVGPGAGSEGGVVGEEDLGGDASEEAAGGEADLKLSSQEEMEKALKEAEDYGEDGEDDYAFVQKEVEDMLEPGEVQGDDGIEQDVEEEMKLHETILSMKELESELASLTATSGEDLSENEREDNNKKTETAREALVTTAEIVTKLEEDLTNFVGTLKTQLDVTYEDFESLAKLEGNEGLDEEAKAQLQEAMQELYNEGVTLEKHLEMAQDYQNHCQSLAENELPVEEKEQSDSSSTKEEDEKEK